MKSLKKLIALTVLALGLAAFSGGPFNHNALASGNTGDYCTGDECE